ncbi:outer membrane beta-barrel protein [Solitalea koreensis]|uniref:Outer membrane protein beta-barrel domain-containing protein n=1 Tax=Solitalea koreensis TaxID=543615 RepID=A0A521BR63_9SPHI|nr:outer membrane beta-barrel protein [Solitalea koreensis]SMO49231.1 Outer membrane protein beta-barrel domain-containing protein [Solitalea koreensis]
MKGTILFIVLFTVIGSSAFAQENDVKPIEGRGWYIGTGVSYFFEITPGEFPNVGPFQPRDHYEERDPLNPAQVLNYTESTITGSFGEGWRAGLSGGYMFTKYFGLQVDVNYFGGKSQLMRRNVIVIQDGPPLINSVATGDVRALIFAPSLVFSIGNVGQIQPYARFGAIIPLYGYLKINTNIIDNVNIPGTAREIARTEKVHPTASLGFQGAIGFNYPVVHKVKVFLEMEYNNAAVNSKDKEVTAYSETRTNTTNGQVTQIGLNDLPIGMKLTDYEKTVTSSSNTEYIPGTIPPINNPNFDPNQKAKDLRSYINIGGLGLTLGVRFRF